jgi:hypothetical protein
MTSSPEGVFCDALGVTYAPGTAPLPGVGALLESVRGRVLSADRGVTLWGVGDGGIVRFEERGLWSRVYTSGRALVHLRMASRWGDLLQLLASEPHKVTRVDAALDVPVDGAAVIAGLRAWVGPRLNLGRKGQAVTWYLQHRESDGLETGTMQVGQRKAERQLRVYDKQREAWDRRREELPPTTRYELEIHGGLGPTLRDAWDPSPMFWANMPREVLAPPGDVPAWLPGGEFLGWASDYSPPLPAVRLKNRVEFSAELDALVALADELGPNGRVHLLRLIKRKLKVPELPGEVVATC